MKRKILPKESVRLSHFRFLILLKLFLAFLLGGACQLQAGTFAQTLAFSKYKLAVGDVFKEVKKQTYNVTSSSKVFQTVYKVDIQAGDFPSEKTLDSELEPRNLNYAIEDNRNIINQGVKKTIAAKKAERTITETKQHEISGTVKDAEGNPLTGVSVTVKGTTTATATDDEGIFTILAEKGDILTFSSIGFISQEIEVGESDTLELVLENDEAGLEEVVVVGYGTQKKVNLTGAVDQVDEKVFENRSMPNVTQGLQGVIPNLNITLSDGKPNRSAGYQIRGTTSIGQGGNALVLIDGVEGDPAMLNPNDIKNVSVLKDASSSAIYGARGAFGVVLITTKSSEKGRTSINYNGNTAINSPTVVPDMVTDAALYARKFVEAYSAYYDYAQTPSAFHKAVPYSQDWYNEMEKRPPGSGKPEVEVGSGGEYVYYGNTDWYDLLYKDRTYGQEHNLSVQGGGDIADFIVSGRYYGQDGLFRYNSDDYKTLNLRAKGSVQVLDWLNVENNLSFSNVQYFNPLTVADGNVWYGLEGEAQPMSPMFNPDGTLTMAAAYGVGDLWYGKSGMESKRRVLRNTTSFTTSFFDNSFHIKGDFTFSNTDLGEITKRVPVPYSQEEGKISYLGSSTNDFADRNALTQYLATNIYGEYEKNFTEEHYFKGMLGYNYEQSIYNTLLTRRNGLLFEDVDDINLTGGEGITINSDYNKWRIAGGFFRLNYTYRERYLLEVNGRLDGSSKFPTDQQWGFFPSVSAGWRISEEPFWAISDDVFSNFKLRASYGSLGNGNVAPYTYMDLFNATTMERLINGKRNQQTSIPSIIPDGLTWETATTANLGLDIDAFRGRLLFSGDAYVRKTKDMFAVGVDLPAVFGATPPKGNYADMTTKGWELTLGWNDQFSVADKPFHYNIKVTLSDYLSKIDQYSNPEKDLGAYYDDRVNYYEGMTIGEIWGYVTEGLFASEEDVKNHASQDLYYASNSGTWLPGDIKFKDLNNDGVIDYGTNKVDDAGDRKVIGNSTPRYAYSLSLGGDWNGFSVSAFFQGIGRQNWWPGTDNALFWGQYNRPYNNIPVSMLDQIWSEENPNAYFPRYRGYVALQSTRELSVVQSRYLQNVAYIRLKNLQIGYSFSPSFLSAAKINATRIYISAENLWSWSPLYKHTKSFDVANIYGEDAEAKSAAANGGTNTIIGNGGQSYSYPLLKSVTMGLSVTF